MSSFQSDSARRAPIAAALALLLASGLPAAGVQAQERAVVSSEITVSSAEARLGLEFLDGGRLEVAFADGEVLLDGESLGSFARGDALDVAWRELLSQAVALENGPLARALIDWSPPAGLEDSAVIIGTTLDEALEEHLRSSTAVTLSQPVDGDPALAFLSRPELLPLIAGALDGVDTGGLQVRVGDPVLRVASGETLEGPLLVVDGEVEVQGTLEGDLILVRSSLRILEGGEITGDVRLADSRLFRDGGQIAGDVTTVEAAAGAAVDRDRLREEIRREIRDEIRGATRVRSQASEERNGPLRNITRGMSGLVGHVMAVLIFSTLGWIVIHFGGARVETVARAARAHPIRAGAVGLAASFLVLPVWILGMLGLIISLVGILVLPFWIVLFPTAVAAAVLLGGIAVATILGEWVASRRLQGLERLRPSNPFHTVLAGVAALFAAFMMADVLYMAGSVTRVLQHLLGAVGTLAIFSTLLVGVGAVLLTRAGARAPGETPPWARSSDPWDDDLFGEGGRRSRWSARWEAERARWRRDDPGEEGGLDSPAPGSTPDDDLPGDRRRGAGDPDDVPPGAPS